MRYYISKVICDKKTLIDLFINWGCLLQFVWTTNYCFVLNYFQWRYLLMFTKFIFCINRTEFTTSLSWKIDSAYVSKSASQLQSSISNEQCFAIIRKIFGTLVCKNFGIHLQFLSVYCFVYQPELSLIPVSLLHITLFALSVSLGQ